MFATVSNQTGYVPDEGKYTVECIDLSEAPDMGYGVGVRWVLALYEGAERVTREDGTSFDFWQTTSPSMGPKARARLYAEAFLGRALDEGERINPQELLGKRLAGMVIHEDSKTKPGTTVAKLVSVKPIASGTAKNGSAPRQAPVAHVTADANSDDVDRALMASTVEKKIGQAVKLQTAKHLDWVAMDLSKLDTDELDSVHAAVQADIDA